MGGGAPAEDMPKEINISSLSHKLRREAGGGREHAICSDRTQEPSQIAALVFVIKAVTCVCRAPSAQSSQMCCLNLHVQTHKKQWQLTVTWTVQKCEVNVWVEDLCVIVTICWYVAGGDKWRLRSASKPRAELIHLWKCAAARVWSDVWLLYFYMSSAYAAFTSSRENMEIAISKRLPFEWCCRNQFGWISWKHVLFVSFKCWSVMLLAWARRGRSHKSTMIQKHKHKLWI